ncbi:MAG: hypothetical protein K9J13_17510 [Saprospiraceae bacterium]|nr:hypothetical protein [Saprospiraceae bacterium]
MTAADIKKHLFRRFKYFEYKLFNVYVFGNESDFLAVSKSGYVWEIEIKVSRSDYFNDFNKTVGFNRNIKKHDYLQSDKTMKPNRFCFAVPKGLIAKDEVPEYAGLIYISEHRTRMIKQPKFLHYKKLLNNDYFLRQMLNKFYYQHMDLLYELDYRQWEIKYKQRRIEFEII